MNKLNNKSESTLSPTVSNVSKQTNSRTVKDKHGAAPNTFASFSEFSTQGTIPATAVEILQLYDEHLIVNKIGTNISNLSESDIYQPLEEVSLMDVFYSKISNLDPKSKSLESLDEESLVPSEYQLSRSDPTLTKITSDKIYVTLNETETIIMFESPQKLEDATSPSSELVKENNEKYESLINGIKTSRHTLNAESQTINPGVKTYSTQLSRTIRMNQKTYVNNWIMFDDYEAERKASQRSSESFSKAKDLHFDLTYKLSTTSDQLSHIYHNTRFQEAVRVILRVLASNTFEVPQKIYKGLYKEEISNPNIKSVYKLELLWTYSIDAVKNRVVSTFAWNHINDDLMAVGYGPYSNGISNNKDDLDGLLLIWCAKNPQNPEHSFKFQSYISALDWCTTKPSRIAIGFYNGEVQVVDISGEKLLVIKRSSKIDSPSYKPYWSVQWWVNDNENDTIASTKTVSENAIFAVNQDGRIICYSMVKNFKASVITRIPRMQNNILQYLANKPTHDIFIFKYMAAMLFRRHPTENQEYFVGSEEGYIFHFSIDILAQPINSFPAHNGPVYSLEFSPFCPEIFVTCGADWCTKIWCNNITEPLITLRTKKSVVKCAVWSPINSVILATIIDHEICLWNLASKTYEPMSVTTSNDMVQFFSLKFTKNGKQLIASDINGNVFIYHLTLMPVPNFDQRKILIKSIEHVLVSQKELLQQFHTMINIDKNKFKSFKD